MSARAPRAAMHVELSTRDEAAALHWFLRHLTFAEAFGSTPPHLSMEARKERAYDIVHAAAALQDAIEKAGLHGDRWMYREVNSAAVSETPRGRQRPAAD